MTIKSVNVVRWMARGVGSSAARGPWAVCVAAALAAAGCAQPRPESDGASAVAGDIDPGTAPAQDAARMAAALESEPRPEQPAAEAAAPEAAPTRAEVPARAVAAGDEPKPAAAAPEAVSATALTLRALEITGEGAGVEVRRTSASNLKLADSWGPLAVDRELTALFDVRTGPGHTALLSVARGPLVRVGRLSAVRLAGEPVIGAGKSADRTVIALTRGGVEVAPRRGHPPVIVRTPDRGAIEITTPTAVSYDAVRGTRIEAGAALAEPAGRGGR